MAVVTLTDNVPISADIPASTSKAPPAAPPCSAQISTSTFGVITRTEPIAYYPRARPWRARIAVAATFSSSRKANIFGGNVIWLITISTIACRTSASSGELTVARAHYYVVLHDGQWKISHNDKHYGPYPTQAAAIRAAVDTAHTAGKQGHDAQVLVQGRNNEWRTEWTYGHDPYPPKG